MKSLPIAALCLASLALPTTAVPAQQPASTPPVRAGGMRFGEHLADYNSELRLANGRVDVETLVARLRELGVTTYYWLVWHAASDWDDLKLFLPKAARAGIQVWVYLVPPSESPPRYGTLYSEPFRLDYPRWAEEIARLSVQHTNLTAWVIDDFHANHRFYTPESVRQLQARAKSINPRLAFLPLLYFSEITRPVVEAYRDVIDGVVVAYPQDREQIDQAWAILNDAAAVLPGQLAHPWNIPSRTGDFVSASVAATVQPAEQWIIRFRERDDFTGPTAGYHFKQLLVQDTVVWEEDVAGGTSGWQNVRVDVSPQVRGRTNVVVAFRLLDKKGVSNFGVRWLLADFAVEGLQSTGTLDQPARWETRRQGAFESGFGAVRHVGERRFHVPFIVMTAGHAGEFRQRHGDPASPERMAQWLRFCLQARKDGKCEGVVTYCLDKEPGSRIFPLARELFRQFSGP